MLTNTIKKTYERNDGHGYIRFNNKGVHILITKTFIENTENKPTVYHIDSNTKKQLY